MVWFKLYFVGNLFPPTVSSTNRGKMIISSWHDFHLKSSLSSRAQLQPYNCSKSHLGEIKCCPCNLTIPSATASCFFVCLFVLFFVFSAPLGKIDLLCFPIRSLIPWFWSSGYETLYFLMMCVFVWVLSSYTWNS